MSEIRIYLEDCDIHSGEDVLFTTLPDEDVQPGDTLRIEHYHGDNVKPDAIYRVVVEVIRETGWQKHRHLVRFNSRCTDSLRKALTYELSI